MERGRVPGRASSDRESALDHVTLRPWTASIVTGASSGHVGSPTTTSTRSWPPGVIREGPAAFRPWGVKRSWHHAGVGGVAVGPGAGAHLAPERGVAVRHRRAPARHHRRHRAPAPAAPVPARGAVPREPAVRPRRGDRRRAGRAAGHRRRPHDPRLLHRDARAFRIGSICSTRRAGSSSSTGTTSGTACSCTPAEDGGACSATATCS